ncbi:MAG: Fatty acid oxidation complex subunit alpha [Planctomycetota bacterium]|jgi:3-hydroxyacyl-CoA dehydrogenase/enoyl-CoA hydratase/3-hydroxybutyryl-CoA epimerase
MNSFKHLRIDSSSADRLIVDIDMQNRKLNVLDEEFFGELERLAIELECNTTRIPVVLRSAKERGFVVGADLRRILEVRSDEEIQRFLKFGQDVLNRWESLKQPTIAWIAGACLGGGMELALACRYRMVSSSADTLLGMPESKLGLTPGWGGTQRLVRRVGVRQGLEMLFYGEPVDARQAMAIRLAEGIWDPADEMGEIARCAATIAARSETESVDSDNLQFWQMEWEACAELRRQATTPDEDALSPLCVPARQAIEKDVRSGLFESIESGLRSERENFFALLVRPEVQATLQRFAKPKSNPS